MEVFARDLYLSVAWIASTQPSLNLRFGHGSRTDALECVQPGCRGLRYSQVPRVIENMLLFICGDWTMQMPTSTRSSAFCIVQDRMGFQKEFSCNVVATRNLTVDVRLCCHCGMLNCVLHMFE